MSIQQSPQNSNVISSINGNHFFVSSQHQQLNSLNEQTNLVQMGVINSNSINTEQSQSVTNNGNGGGLGGGHMFLNLNSINIKSSNEQNINVSKINESSFFDDQQKQQIQQNSINSSYIQEQRTLESVIKKFKFICIFFE